MGVKHWCTEHTQYISAANISVPFLPTFLARIRPKICGGKCSQHPSLISVGLVANISLLSWQWTPLSTKPQPFSENTQRAQWVPNYGCDLIFWLFHVNKPYLPHIIKRQHGIYIGMADQFSKENVCSSWFCHQWAAWTLASPLTSLSLRSCSVLTPSLPSYIMATRAWTANWQQTPDLSQHSWESQRHSYT